MRRVTTDGIGKRILWSARLAVRAPLEARFPFHSPRAIGRAQRRRIEATVVHAHEHVPYYRETMRKLALGPGDIRTEADLARLPLIEREQVQRDPEYFVSRAHPLDSYLNLRSGGSTAEPVTVFRHPLSLFEGAAINERLRSLIVRLAGRRLRFSELLIVLPDSPGGSRDAFDSRSLLPSSLRVARDRLSILTPPSEAAAALDELRPDVLATYGSYLEALFAHLEATGARVALPKVAAFSSDGLSDAARRLITGLGVHVLGAYRAIEAPWVGFECERHRGYHLNVDLSPVRIVDRDGDDVAEGEGGEVVSSDLTSVGGTILLNYRLGDIAARLPDRCECGRNLPLISYIEGRSAEWLVGPAGELIHGQALRDLMRRRQDVLRYQVVQRAPDRLTVTLAATSGSDAGELRAWIARRFAERLGEGVRTEVVFSEDLPRTARGKTLRVISELESTARARVQGGATSGAEQR